MLYYWQSDGSPTRGISAVLFQPKVPLRLRSCHDWRWKCTCWHSLQSKNSTQHPSCEDFSKATEITWIAWHPFHRESKWYHPPHQQGYQTQSRWDSHANPSPWETHEDAAMPIQGTAWCPHSWRRPPQAQSMTCPTYELWASHKRLRLHLAMLSIPGGQSSVR